MYLSIHILKKYYCNLTLTWGAQNIQRHKKLNSIGFSSRLLKVAHPVKKTTVKKGYIKKQGFNNRVSDGVVESLVAIR